MEELIYRPPFEADSFLLQVTHGCSHNRCSFCTMYRGIPFSLFSMEEIEAQLIRASRRYSGVQRVFLENGDPFALSAERLLDIASLVHRYLPCTETIAMYASVRNIMTKTDEELAKLRSAGINELNVGVESGLDEALAYMNKGYTAEEALHALMRLKKAGIDYGANIILGCASKERRRENALKTAELLNKTEPYLIFTGTIHADQGCPLYEDMKNGVFAESTIGEYLEEEEILLEALEKKHCFLFSLHPSNIVRMQGFLDRHGEEMLAYLRKRKSELTDVLDQIPARAEEGGITGLY